MADIYVQHDAAFRLVSAYVILKDGVCVATVGLKFPKDGAGRLQAYVHWLGTPMVRGTAGGYGYDKRSAAIANAVSKMVTGTHLETGDGPARQFYDALAMDSGDYWDGRLRKAGFTVQQVV